MIADQPTGSAEGAQEPGRIRPDAARDEARGTTLSAGERYGPLLLERTRKADGRLLIYYRDAGDAG